MKKFKLTWDQRICDDMGDTLYFEEKSQIIEAENVDAACDIWEKENKHNDGQNGLDSCVEVVEHELFKKLLIVTMPDSSEYGVPIELIARNRAEHYKDEFNDDVAESLREDTLPLFESSSYEIHDWAANNMNLSDVESDAILIKKADVDFQDGWVNGDWKVA